MLQMEVRLRPVHEVTATQHSGNPGDAGCLERLEYLAFSLDANVVLLPGVV